MFKTRPIPKPFVNRYALKEKNKARSLLIDRAKKSGNAVEKVFTLPAEEGFCAIEFKVAFNCYVVGFELSGDLVRFNKLLSSGIVDELYQANVFDLAKPDAMLAGVSLGHLTSRPTDIGPLPHIVHDTVKLAHRFDIMFLDYTALLTESKVDETITIVDRFANSGGTIGVTFTLDEEMAVSKQNIILNKFRRFTNCHIERYRNAASNMVLVIFQR